ncbi:MAG: hypothetical protein EOO53_13845 [Gammaproteobacteria bacterium]|nr:MAG: hypothetical protein EOO53_13845 [Gammaproteobacteria bacterium]
MKVFSFLSIVLASLISFNAHASGYGWYVNSFDLKEFTKWKQQVDAKNNFAREYFGPSLQKTAELKSIEMVLNTLAYPTPESNTLKVNEESPKRLEYYWADSLHYAYKVSNGELKTFFSLFENGRSLWFFHAPSECEFWGYCADTYFVLSYDEIVKFHAELSKLNKSVKHPADHADYLIHIESVLQKAEVEHRGLFFWGHD